MSCIFCTNPFAEGDKNTEGPCGCISHTSCGYRVFAEYIESWDRQPLSCPSCFNVIYKSRHVIDTENTKKQLQLELDRLYKNKSFKNDLKLIKMKQRKLSKASSVFKKYLIPKRVLFKSTITPHIDVIKGIHNQIKQEVRLEPSYKTNITAYSSYMLSRENFCKKYDLSQDCLKELKLTMKRWGMKSMSPFALVKRSFRISMRLW